MDSKGSVTRKREGILPKARRLVAEGRVEDLGAGHFEVRGDTHPHTLAFSKNPEFPDIHCSCPSRMGGRGCSHRMAVELFLSKTRRGV